MSDDLFKRLGRASGGLMIHGIDSSAITEAVTEIATLTKQRDALLAVVYMHKADTDPEVSFGQFFAIVNGFGRDSEKESAAEFMERLEDEAIAMCPEPTKRFALCPEVEEGENGETE